MKADNEEPGMLGSLKIALEKCILSQLVHTLCQINLKKTYIFARFFILIFSLIFRFYGEYISGSRPNPWAGAGPHGQLASYIIIDLYF